VLTQTSDGFRRDPLPRHAEPDRLFLPRIGFASAVLALASFMAARGQVAVVSGSPRKPLIVAADSGARMEQLTTGVYAIIRGHANSPNDITIYLPVERILVTGDIVVWPVPYTFDAYPRPWTRVLQELENLLAVAIVPGHGPVMADHTYIRQVRGLLEAASAQVDTMIRRGRLRPDVEQAVNLEALKPSFVRPGDATAETYWDAAVKHSLIERVYQCLQGSRC
jgi:hypothetical protein